MRERFVASLLVVVVAALAAAGAGQRALRKAEEMRAHVRARAIVDDAILRAVVLGDSVARGAGDERGRGIAGWLDAELRARGARVVAVVNLGVDGARTRDVAALLGRAHALSVVRSADLIVLSVGGNDLYGDARAQLLARVVPFVQQHRAVTRVERLVAEIRGLNPAARIYILGLYNPYRRTAMASWLDRQVNLWDARLIARFASADAVRVVRICDLLEREDRLSAHDRFHPGWEGYRAIAERVAASW